MSNHQNTVYHEQQREFKEEISEKELKLFNIALDFQDFFVRKFGDKETIELLETMIKIIKDRQQDDNDILNR